MKPIEEAWVLLSGGMDSTAALHWSLRRYDDVSAILFDYGQPARDHELVAAERACDELRVRRARLRLAGALPRAGLAVEGFDPASRAEGSSPAVVPGRNAVLLAAACAHAAHARTGGVIRLVVGFNADDAAGFSDCRKEFLYAMEAALGLGVGRTVRLLAPFVAWRKAAIAVWAAGEGGVLRRHVAASWSCYLREGPCGRCSACELRAAALAAAGIDDACAPAAMTGGDPARRLR